MTAPRPQLTAATVRQPAAAPYAGFDATLRTWLRRADRSQKELAHALGVDPSTVTTWAQGQKRPAGRALVKLLAHFRGWFGHGWDPREALDACACLGYEWLAIQEVCARHFQKGGILKPS